MKTIVNGERDESNTFAHSGSHICASNGGSKSNTPSFFFLVPPLSRASITSRVALHFAFFLVLDRIILWQGAFLWLTICPRRLTLPTLPFAATAVTEQCTPTHLLFCTQLQQCNGESTLPSFSPRLVKA